MIAQDDDASSSICYFPSSIDQNITMSIETIGCETIRLFLWFSYRKSFGRDSQDNNKSGYQHTHTKCHEFNRRPNKCELIYTLFNSITQSSSVIVSGLHTNAQDTKEKCQRKPKTLQIYVFSLWRRNKKNIIRANI